MNIVPLKAFKGFARGFFLTLCFWITASSAWADCPGEVRAVNAEEKVLAAWVDSVFPGLIQVSSDYVLNDGYQGNSREMRCAEGVNDPYYLSISMRYTAQGATQESLQSDMNDMSAQMKKMMEEMQRMQAAGVPAEQAFAKIEEDKKALVNQSKAAEAKSGVAVKAYFNADSSKCTGERVNIPGASLACSKTKKHKTSMYVLFGPWQKGSMGPDDYRASFSPAKTSGKLQSVAILFEGIEDIIEDLVRRTDWASIANRIGK